MIDKKDVKQTSETAGERLRMTPDDAIYSLEFRTNDLKTKYSKGEPAPPIVAINIKSYESTTRLVDDVLQHRPDATLQDVSSELSQRLQQNLPTDTLKRIEAAVKEINSLLMDFKGDINRLTEQEREYVLAHRKPPKTETGSETEVIRDILRRGVFRATFSASLIKKSGEQEWDGWKDFYSHGKDKGSWGGTYQPDPLALALPEAFDTSGRCFDGVQNFLSDDNVADVTTIQAMYTRQEKKKTLNTVDRKTNTVTTVTEFDRNQPTIYPGTTEPAIRIAYQTLTRGNTKESQMYTDGNGRRGNCLTLEMVVPLSVAENIVRNGKGNSAFFRNLAQSAVLDEQVGIASILGNNEFGYTKDATEWRKDRTVVRNVHGGLPPYEDEDWKKSKMVVSIDLNVPQEDQVAKIANMSPVSGFNQVEQAKQLLSKMIVSPNP